MSANFTRRIERSWRDCGKHKPVTEDGRMSVFGKLGAAIIRTATIPLSVVADIATLGGVMNDHGESYTAGKVRRIVDDIEDAADEARGA